MNKSTGGLVLLDKTSVNDGSLFLRLDIQSSCCFSSPSILAGAGECRESSCQSALASGSRRDQRTESGCKAKLNPDVNHVAEARYLCARPRTHRSSYPTMSFAKVLSPALREIRIICCQSNTASAGTRSAFK